MKIESKSEIHGWNFHFLYCHFRLEKGLNHVAGGLKDSGENMGLTGTNRGYRCCSKLAVSHICSSSSMYRTTHPTHSCEKAIHRAPAVQKAETVCLAESGGEGNHKSAHGEEVKVVEKKIKQIEPTYPGYSILLTL